MTISDKELDKFQSQYYETELKQILKIWMFYFDCIDCRDSNEPAKHKYITEYEKGNKKHGTYPSPPILYCGCGELLYNIRSIGLYDLIKSLFESDKNNKIIIKLEDDTISKIEDTDYEFTPE